MELEMTIDLIIGAIAFLSGLGLMVYAATILEGDR